jgi:hypothetical protein
MTYIVTSDQSLSRVISPRLPNATVEYDQNYINQLNSILRLYFNQIDNILNQFMATNTSFVNNNEDPLALPSYMQVSRGLVSGATLVNIFGYQSTVGTSFVPIWENATTYTHPTVATTMLLYSSSASDTNVSITINGLDASYNPISETKILTNGTTGVTTTNSYLRIQNILVTTSTSVNPVGIIRLANAGKTITFAQIAIGAGRSQMSIFTVPNGYIFYLTRIQVFAQQSGGSNNFNLFRANSTTPTGIVTNILTSPFFQAYSVTREAPIVYQGKTDLEWQTMTNADTSSCGCSIEGILIATGTP